MESFFLLLSEIKYCEWILAKKKQDGKNSIPGSVPPQARACIGGAYSRTWLYYKCYSKPSDYNIHIYI